MIEIFGSNAAKVDEKLAVNPAECAGCRNCLWSLGPHSGILIASLQRS